MKYHHITDLIGNTPVLRLARMFPHHQVWIKVERTNPGGSLKDRIAHAMIRDAEEKKILKKGMTIIEPTSGNTGIGLAMVGASKGYRVILVMSERMSEERKKVMRAFGAELILTPSQEGTPGAVRKAVEIARTHKDYWMPMQFENPANPHTHEHHTAQEIIEDFDSLSYLITACGTGGHISGLARRLKPHYKNLKILGVEPAVSPVLSGGSFIPHKIAGTGPGFIPKNTDLTLLDGILLADEDLAYTYTRRLAKEEGLLAGVSTGAALSVIDTYIQTHNIAKHQEILAINYDLGERYLSVPDLFV